MMRPAPRRRRAPLWFPPSEEADEQGLLCVGGDLEVDRLLLAYRSGIFPWYGRETPILWWSPDPRSVLFPRELHLPRRLVRRLRTNPFEVRADTAFAEVVSQCATVPRPGQDGTWIVREMVEAYIRLHAAGWAHSVETWRNGRLVGGVYGVAIGGAFFGESMFALEPDASKAALGALASKLVDWDFELLDCQVRNATTERLGARDIPRPEFMERLASALAKPDRRGAWTEHFPPPESGIRNAAL